MKRTIFFIMALLCTVYFSACANIEETKNMMPELEYSFVTASSLEIPEQTVSKGTQPERAKPDTLSEEQTQWRTNKCPDLPQPYVKVLNHYEEFMNADNRDINDESVQEKLRGGEWKDLCDEVCMPLSSWRPEKGDHFFYALKDLTGDGFPEMIIAYRSNIDYKYTPKVVYTYREENGIVMECATSYFTMTIYDNNVIEYVSGGMYSSTTYLQFQEDAGGWVVVDTIADSGTWDSATNSMVDVEYYGGEWDERGLLDTQISEEEYQQIRQKYVTTPMTFEWIPLVYHASSANS